MPRKLDAAREASIMHLYGQGLHGGQIAARLGIARSCVYRRLPKQGRPHHRWTDAEMQVLVDGYATGRPVRDIARRIGCSPTAARVKMCRYRKSIRADPRKRAVMYWLQKGLATGARPGEVIRAIRRAKILQGD